MTNVAAARHVRHGSPRVAPPECDERCAHRDIRQISRGRRPLGGDAHARPRIANDLPRANASVRAADGALALTREGVTGLVAVCVLTHVTPMMPPHSNPRPAPDSPRRSASTVTKVRDPRTGCGASPRCRSPGRVPDVQIRPPRPRPSTAQQADLTSGRSVWSAVTAGAEPPPAERRGEGRGARRARGRRGRSCAGWSREVQRTRARVCTTSDGA